MKLVAFQKMRTQMPDEPAIWCLQYEISIKLSAHQNSTGLYLLIYLHAFSPSAAQLSSTSGVQLWHSRPEVAAHQFLDIQRSATVLDRFHSRSKEENHRWPLLYIVCLTPEVPILQIYAQSLREHYYASWAWPWKNGHAICFLAFAASSASSLKAWKQIPHA